MTILDLLRTDGISAKKAASTRGGEYASPCPMCGGKDRFRSWPEEGDGGKWWCRQCGKGGDLIQYLRDVRGLPFREACNLLGKEVGSDSFTSSTHKDRSSTQWEPRDSSPPPDSWAAKASMLVAWAEDQLWSENGKEIQRWLLKERGLTDTTIKDMRLGWIPKDLRREREDWGLPRQLKDNGKPKSLWIPMGLVIPYSLDNGIVKVKIRRSDPAHGPRYYLLPGSSTTPMIIGAHKKSIVVVESELDAILIHQEAGDLVGVVALGSAQVRPDREAMRSLEIAEAILVALDLDMAGAKETWRWWMKRFEKAFRWSPIRGKDPGEMWKSDVSIRAWIEAGIAEAHEQDRSLG